MTRDTFRRISALGLLAGPILFALGDLMRRLVEPSGSPSAPAITRAVGDHSTAWLSAGMLSLLAAPLLVTGVAGLVLDARGRGGRTTMIGAWMVAIGAFASIGHAVAFYASYALYDRAGIAPSTANQLDDASEGYPLLVVLIALFVVGMMLGSIVLFVGLRLARRVPVWSAVATVVFVVAGSSGGVPAGVVGLVAALAAFGSAARSLADPAVSATHDRMGGDVILPT
jgi:hypothetical protein